MTDEDKKLVDAANMIKDYCKKVEVGEKCPFSVKETCDILNCRFRENKNIVPGDWNVPKISRWTDADIALAKALMAFGVKEVKESCGAVLFVYESLCVKAPDGAFSALNPDETVYLKDIVAEGEKDG